MSRITNYPRSGPMAAFALIAVSLILTGCGGPLKTPPFSARQQLKPGESTRKDVLRLLGKPEQEADIPRFMLPAEISQKCLPWNEYRLHALIYKRYDYEGAYDIYRQETQVYLSPAGKVCASGSWVWKKNDHKKTWTFSQQPEF